MEYVKYTLKSRQLYPQRVFLCQFFVTLMPNLQLFFNTGLTRPPPLPPILNNVKKNCKIFILGYPKTIGTCSAGLRTTVQPAAKAVAHFQLAIGIG